jgi:predicted peroxiredoxin
MIKQTLIVLIAGIVMLVSGCIGVDNSEKIVEYDPSLLINLTSDATVDAHSSMMGLNMALTMARDDMDVTVFTNVKGVKLFDPANDSITGPLLEVLGEIMEAGGTVLACPMCMEAVGIEEDWLPEGVELSALEKMKAILMEAPTAMSY